MKKILATLLAISLLMALFLPTVAYAKDGNDKDGKERRDRESGRYAIVIGISDYPGPLSVLEGGLDIFYADDDAQAMRTTLISQGFSPRNVDILINQRATKEAILEKIDDLGEKVRQNDTVVFYFSGHSSIPDAFSEAPNVWPGQTPAPADADIGIMVWGEDGNPDLVYDTELTNAFSEFKTNKILFVFDACYTARFDNLAGPGRIVISAAGPENYAISGEYGRAYAFFGVGPLPGIGWMNQGLFTYFFVVKGLNRGLSSRADFDRDRDISVEEAFYYAQAVLTAMTEQFSAWGLYEIPVMIDDYPGDFDL